jgi:dTDP-4-amino-4,6-dideoxygalactose transaminase
MLIARASRFARYCYAVPWCVPQWGWREFGASVSGSLSVRTDSASAWAVAACAMMGVDYAIPVAQGRMAIELGLRGLAVGPGDDVVLPSFVCTSVLQAVLHTGARPVFADVGCNLNVTLETVLDALTMRTRCVVVPHLFGAPAPIGSIERALRERGISLLDDAAQALGARVEGRPLGSFGNCGVLSCGPGKPLAGSGGGLLVTGDRELFDRASTVVRPEESVRVARRRVWRFWVRRRFRRLSLPVAIAVQRVAGWSEHSEEPDYQIAALADVEGRVCLTQFRRLGETAAQRRANAAAILAAIGPLGRYNEVDIGPDTASMKLALVLPEGGPSAEDMIEAFADGGVECQRGYVPCHHRVENPRGAVPYTDKVWRRVVCVPLSTRLPSPRRLSVALGRLSASE